MKRPILIVSGDFMKTGGMDRANYALADYLSRRGDLVHLVAYRAASDLMARKNLTLHKVPKPLNSYTLARPLLDRSGRDWARRLMPSGGRVIVNGGNCRWGDINWVHHINLLDRPKSIGVSIRRFKVHFDYRAHVMAERVALRMARILITTCEKNRQDLIKRFGLPEERVKVIPYGIDSQVFHPATADERRSLRRQLGWDEQKPVYLFVGALGDRRKGFDTLFAAWASLCQRSDWDADLVVVGDGAECSSWEARAAEEGLADRIRFMGFRNDVPDLFRACDAHVLPSRYEGYSLVTQEALCCGLPAFITRTAGIAERFEGHLADILLISDPNDAPALAERLYAWRNQAEAVRPMLQAFSDRLRAFTWDHMAEQLAGIIENGPISPGPNRF